ncbi:hypothetical protein [Nocardiopsis synnemataformans]|uniref:hypothetical protein n=1 Tax=Nocardiopsis synnemataformans TaxID=61305 RepID=UPI003EB917E9
MHWANAPSQARDIVTALATHWGARPDLQQLKACYARAQAPRLATKAVRRTAQARRRFAEAGAELARAFADEHHQDDLRRTENLEAATQLLGRRQIWNEYSVHGVRDRDSDEFVVAAVLDIAGAVADDGMGDKTWQPHSPVVVATSPDDAAAQATLEVENLDRDDEGDD